MSYLSYNHLFQAALAQAETGEVDEAIAHFLKIAPEFPQRFERMTFHYHAQILGRAGRVAEAIQVFQTAQEQGHWYPPGWLWPNDPGLDPILAHPDFADWLERNAEMTKAARAQAEPELYVLPPADENNNAPLLLTLHGNNSHAFETQDYWEAATELNYMLAVPQSSQMDGKNAYVWNDFSIGETQVKAHYEALLAEGNFNADQVVLGGFSMGAGLAAWVSLSGLIPVKGVILIAPYIPDLDTLIGYMKNPAIQHLKFYILIGQQDNGCLPNTQKLYQALQDHGFACKIELRDQYAHTYPDDFDDVLEKALKFVLK